MRFFEQWWERFRIATPIVVVVLTAVYTAGKGFHGYGWE